MPYSGMTKKPCEGCGEARVAGRRIGEVCWECQRLMADGRKAREKAAAETERIRVSVVSFKDGAFSHSAPSFYTGKGGSTHENDLLHPAFWKLLALLIEPVPGEQGWSQAPLRLIPFPSNTSSNSYNAGSPATFFIDPAVHEAANALYTAIRAALDSAWENGHRQGQSLMLGLAEGSLSLERLEERLIKPKKG